MDLQPEIYAPAPGTPPHERKFRREREPGAAAIHWGLKDQKLPADSFAYGMRNSKQESVVTALEAQKKQNQSYQNEVAERVYWSNKHEPLGKGYVAGHVLPPETQDVKFHFGVPSKEKDESKAVIWPRDSKRGEDEEIRQQYVKTHGDFAPGEMFNRKYAWPVEVTSNPHFRFGAGDGSATKDGQGVKDALNMDREVEDAMPITRIVQRTLEDKRQVKNDAIGKVKHYGTGKPPVPPGHAFGARKSSSAYGGSAWDCITGNYSLDEQLPDRDLGRCVKPGRRNVTQESRAFGVPSVRRDLSAPAPQKRGLGDQTSYSDEHHMKLLISPQRFVLSGIEDEDFLLRRGKQEVHILLTGAGYAFKDQDFDEIWRSAMQLFQDGRSLVSLDAFMFVYSDWLDQAVAEKRSALSQRTAWA